MRLALYVSLIALGLVAVGMGTVPVAACARAGRGEVVSTGNDLNSPSWTVTGWGKTLEDADQVALDNARKTVLDYLAHQKPPIQAQPSADYIDKQLVKERSQETRDLPDLGQMYQATLTVELDPKHYRDLLESDRQERMQHRQLLLAEVLAGVLAVLGAVVGYVRLDEATKGYYTGWLRLAAVVLIGAVGVALYFFIARPPAI